MSDDRSRRKELAAEFRETSTEAGVYRISVAGADRALVGSAVNLASVRNKVAFAQATNSPGALDHRLTADIHRFGVAALGFEVLESFTPPASHTRAQVAADLATLEQLWRERLGAAAVH